MKIKSLNVVVKSPTHSAGDSSIATCLQPSSRNRNLQHFMLHKLNNKSAVKVGGLSQCLDGLETPKWFSVLVRDLHFTGVTSSYTPK